MPGVCVQSTYLKGSEFPQLQEGKLRCYTLLFCPYAQRVRLVLVHKEIPEENIDFINFVPQGGKPDWFLERNPLGFVPVLEKDGKIISGSVACCEYLDDVYPQNRLTPADPYIRARDRMILDWCKKMMSAFDKICVTRGMDDEAIEKYVKAVKQIEEAIGERGKFLGGETVAMLDYYIWPWIERLPVLKRLHREIYPAAKYPNLRAWTKEMMKVPAVQKCYIKPEEHRTIMMSSWPCDF